MRLIAQKPCSFEGKKFFIGDEIPESYVANAKTLEKMGVIAIVSDGGVIPPEELQQYTAKVGEVKFEVIIRAEEGELPVYVTNEELSVFTDILQLPVKTTEDKQKVSDMIHKVNSDDLLIMLDALDGRKHVSEEAKARAAEIQLNSEPEADADGEAEQGSNE